MVGPDLRGLFCEARYSGMYLLVLLELDLGEGLELGGSCILGSLGIVLPFVYVNSGS
jgi:hypothetical protein